MKELTAFYVYLLKNKDLFNNKLLAGFKEMVAYAGLHAVHTYKEIL